MNTATIMDMMLNTEMIVKDMKGGKEDMTEKRYMSYYGEVLDTWFGYDGNNEPTEWEIREKDYLVIGECKTTDDADNVCKRLNELQNEVDILKASNVEMEDYLARLEEKNEQLKSEYKLLHIQYRDLQKFVENNFDEYLTQEKLNRQIIKLSDENEQLKQSYKEFEDECQSTFNAMNRKQNDLYRKNFKLKEENEQLKKELSDFKQTVYGFEEIIDLKNWQQKYENR